MCVSEYGKAIQMTMTSGARGGPQYFTYYKARHTANNKVPLSEVADDTKVVIRKSLLVQNSVLNETEYEVVIDDDVDNTLKNLNKTIEEMVKSGEKRDKLIEKMSQTIEEMQKAEEKRDKSIRELQTENEHLESEIIGNFNLMKSTGEMMLEMSKRRRRCWE